MLILYTGPSKQSMPWRRLVDLPIAVERNKCISFRSRNRISEPSSGPREGRASSFHPYEERESKCHFPLRLWIITFMLWDRFASLIWKTISCLDETFPWMLSINWALKLLTRNSGLSCLKTQSGSWKHRGFLDLQKLAFSMRLLTALFVWYSGRAIWNNPCLSIIFPLSVFVSLFSWFYHSSLSVSASLLLAPLLFLSLSCSLFLSHIHTHTSFTFDFFFFFFGSHSQVTQAQLRYYKAER